MKAVRLYCYPSRDALALWHKHYTKNGGLRDAMGEKRSRYSPEETKAAADDYLEHCRSLRRTMRAVKQPSVEALTEWVDDKDSHARCSMVRLSE
jgi:L-lactate utilization protein LutB